MTDIIVTANVESVYEGMALIRPSIICSLMVKKDIMFRLCSGFRFDKQFQLKSLAAKR